MARHDGAAQGSEELNVGDIEIAFRDAFDHNAACDMIDTEAAVFDRYTRQRHKAQTDFVQAQTIQNKRALEEKDPVIRRKQLDELRRISEDVKLHKQFLYRSGLFDSLRIANAVE